jgi:NNP family nitrate/nitrite transporter-like MFS transporter
MIVGTPASTFLLLAGISVCDFTFAAWMPPLPAGIGLLVATYMCFGLGNGATFQLVPQRWKRKIGLMSGIIGAAGGIGGFYLPVIMRIAKESTGSYQMGFATFGGLSAIAFALVVLHRTRWLEGALPREGPLVADAMQPADVRVDNP